MPNTSALLFWAVPPVRSLQESRQPAQTAQNIRTSESDIGVGWLIRKRHCRSDPLAGLFGHLAAGFPSPTGAIMRSTDRDTGTYDGEFCKT